MHDLLARMFAAKAVHRQEAVLREPFAQVHTRAINRVGERRFLRLAIEEAPGIGIIAEIKRASPSAGLITRNFDPVEIAQAYQAIGVDAISVITEQDHFLGDLSYLDLVRSHTTRPILRKDFLATPYDVAQAAAYGADAILLIVAGLDDEALRVARDQAREYALDVLLEVHDEDELERAVALGPELIGVNNRDLRTFQTDLTVGERLLPRIPNISLAIAESGIVAIADILRMHRAAARGVLIGETLMRHADKESFIRSAREALARLPA